MTQKVIQITKETTSPDSDHCQPASADSSSEPLDWEVISSYSRAQALADGVLVDITELAREAGFRYPVAITSAALYSCVEGALIDHVHDVSWGLLDMLNMLRDSFENCCDSSEIGFWVEVSDGQASLIRVFLKCLCGPGDDAEPVLTIMLPEED